MICRPCNQRNKSTSKSLLTNAFANAAQGAGDYLLIWEPQILHLGTIIIYRHLLHRTPHRCPLASLDHSSTLGSLGPPSGSHCSAVDKLAPFLLLRQVAPV
jgi:hypothetical protein